MLRNSFGQPIVHTQFQMMRSLSNTLRLLVVRVARGVDALAGQGPPQKKGDKPQHSGWPYRLIFDAGIQVVSSGKQKNKHMIC